VVLVLLATCVPYAIAWWFTPGEAIFPGILFNSDDHGVYFAWMRQAQDGHLLFRNLFTTEPQRGIYLHVYFLALGWLSRLPGLDIPLAYHLGRVVGGAAALLLAYRLVALATPDRFTRLCALWTVALSAGVGWMFWADKDLPAHPVDVWQPEAITFASLYTNGLFAVSLALMLGIVVCLLRAEDSERHGAWWAVGAGGCGLVLGNTHSYDMIHLTLVWTAYLVMRWGTERRFPVRAVGLALLAAVVAAPSVAYMAWLYLSEPIFKARADTATWSPWPQQYLLGYGLLLPLAAWGGWLLWRTSPTDQGPAPERRLPNRATVLLVVWPIAGFIAAYLPFAFQRKMIMGTHLPLGLLAGVALAALAQGAAARIGKPRLAGVVAALGVLLLCPSNFRYMARDVSLISVNRTSTFFFPVHWPEAELHAFTWLGKNTPPTAAMFSYPLSAVLTPAYSGRAVYAGHWGETPRYMEKMREAVQFYGGTWSNEERHEFLRFHGITHVYVGDRERQLMERGLAHGGTSFIGVPFLRPVFQEGISTLYEVVGG
jgi:hypothetical protein